MGLLDDLRVDIGDDDGAIPSGVPSHSLLSPAHTDTVTELPTPGTLIVGENPVWGTLPVGSENEVLTVVSGFPTWSVDAAGASGLAAHAADPNAHHTRYTDAEASGVAVQVVVTGILQHTAISDAHHARYTDAEASGVAVQVVTTGIAQHAAIPDVHHARYTDAEASGVAVLVVTTGIAEHAAISGAHHPRYTDTEAAIVAAAVLATGVVSAENVAILQESGVELIVDATTTAVLPTTSVLLSTNIDLINPSGNLRIAATAAINANGGVPVHFHIYIDGAFYRATTINVTGAIDNASIVIPRVATTGVNPHTVELRWAKFNQPLVTVFCLPSTFPDFYHASLSVQEVK